MLIGAHQRRRAVGQRKAKPVRADLALGVGESGRQVHVVERLQQAVIPAHPAEHHAVGVGEHHADRLVGQRAMQIEKHLVTALEEQGAEVVGAGEDGFDDVLRDAVLLAALPGRQQPTGHRVVPRGAAAVQLRPLREVVRHAL